MATRARQRRNQVLSREQIIDAAIELLDEGGEDALTVRALTERLTTGPARSTTAWAPATSCWMRRRKRSSPQL